MDLNIIDMLLTVNKYSRPGTKLNTVKGVAIHYVGNPGSSAKGNRNYFESLKDSHKTYASSHYIIDLDGTIIRCIPETEIAYCTNDRNKDTISIENTHPLSDGKFTQETYTSLVKLIADICTRYKLNPLTDVIRHYDVTKKACPLWHVNHPEDFDGLKWDVKKLMEENKEPEVKTYTKLNINGDIISLRGDNKDGTIYSSISELSRVFGDVKIPLRQVLDSMGFKVEWDSKNNMIMATTHGVCNKDLVELRKIVECEAGGEPYEGKVAVASVILNRVKSQDFPNTIHDVIFEPKQFSPITNGAFNKVVVSKDTEKAVDEALLKGDNVNGATYFRTIKGAEGSWHEVALKKIKTIGNHNFYS